MYIYIWPQDPRPLPQHDNSTSITVQSVLPGCVVYVCTASKTQTHQGLGQASRQPEAATLSVTGPAVTCSRKCGKGPHTTTRPAAGSA